MQEIDFLPQWYRDKRRREGHYRVQYLGISCLLVVMVVWTAITARSISVAERHLAGMQAASAASDAANDFRQMRTELDRLRVYDVILSRVDQRLRMSGAIAELSFLSGSRVRFQRVSISAEQFPQKDASASVPANTIRAVREAMTEKSGPYAGDIRFKIILRGIAADGTHVASLIRKLEDSPWFFKVTPAFCKNGTVGEHVVSEFEITCYVANYTEEKMPVAQTTAKASHDTKGPM